MLLLPLLLPYVLAVMGGRPLWLQCCQRWYALFLTAAPFGCSSCCFAATASKTCCCGVPALGLLLAAAIQCDAADSVAHTYKFLKCAFAGVVLLPPAL